jgi:hypothetical protein
MKSEYKSFYEFQKNNGFFVIVHDGAMDDDDFNEIKIGNSESVTFFLLNHEDHIYLFGGGMLEKDSTIKEYYFNKIKEPSQNEADLMELALEKMKSEHRDFIKNQFFEPSPNQLSFIER